MPLGSLFGDIVGVIGRGVQALGTGGISEYQRNQSQDIGQVLASAQTPGEAISKLGQLGTPGAVELATKLQASLPAFNPLNPQQAAAYGAQIYSANPLMNSPPDLGALAQGIMPGQTQAGQQPATAPQGATSPSPPIAPGGQQAQGINPRELTGDDWLSYLNNKVGPGFANQVKAIAEGRQAPPPPGSRSSTAAMLSQAVAQYKPDFDFAKAGENFKNSQATETEFTKGDAAKNIRSIGTASNHLATLVGQVAGVANTAYPMVNGVKNWFSQETGGSGITKFNQTADALAGELGAVYKGAGHNSDNEISTMRRALNPDASPEQKYGALENGLNLMTGRADELAQQYNKGKNLSEGDTGYKTPEDFLSPQAKANISAAKEAIFNFKAKGAVSAGQAPSQLSGLQAPAIQGAQASKTIGGKTYHLVNGQWMQ